MLSIVLLPFLRLCYAHQDRLVLASLSEGSIASSWQFTTTSTSRSVMAKCINKQETHEPGCFRLQAQSTCRFGHLGEIRIVQGRGEIQNAGSFHFESDHERATPGGSPGSTHS